MVHETHTLDRRRVLTVLGASGTVGLAGCIGGDDEDDDGLDMAEVCDEPDTEELKELLPDFREWGDAGRGGGGSSFAAEYEYQVYEHEDYEDTSGYVVHITDHERWDRDELLDVADELSGWSGPLITYVEVGDWVYMALGPSHEVNRELLEEFEPVSTDCAQAAAETDLEDE